MSDGHSHSHVPSLRAGARHRNRLAIAFVLITVFFVVEAVGGVLTNSLALLSDAGHMLTDVVGMGMALAAIQLATRHEQRAAQGFHQATSRNTFGLYRLEILAALANAVLLVAVAMYVVFESIMRLFDEPEVLGLPMLAVATVGFLVNVAAFLLLREGAQESLNLEGAYLEVLADTIGSVGVIIAALALQLFGWTWADPVMGALIGLWILPRTFRLGRQAVRILLQAAPPDLDLDELAAALHRIDGVIDVHDLHVWTLTSEMDAASAHLMVRKGTDQHAVLDRARELFQDHCGISHGTFQVEPEDHTGCEEVAW